MPGLQTDPLGANRSFGREGLINGNDAARRTLTIMRELLICTAAKLVSGWGQRDGRVTFAARRAVTRTAR